MWTWNEAAYRWERPSWTIASASSPGQTVLMRVLPRHRWARQFEHAGTTSHRLPLRLKVEHVGERGDEFRPRGVPGSTMAGA